VKKPAQFQPADSICQFLCPETLRRPYTLKTQNKTKQNKQIIIITNNYNPYIQSQNTNRSLQNNIPHPKYTTNVQIHSLQNNIHVSKVHRGSAFEPGASGLPYYCTAPVWCSCCNWRASCVVTKTNKQKFQQNKNHIPLWAWICL